jgi:hypothetical protein
MVLCVSLRTLPLALLLTLPLGCTAAPLPDDGGSGGAGTGSQSGSGSSSGTGSTGSGGVGAPIVTVNGLNILPARIRRLTNAEYNASVQSLLGTSASPADEFPPDTRQHGYTTNEAQRVDPVLARALDASASVLAAAARSDFGNLAPCADTAGGAEACAQSFIDSFGQKAYRRPLDADDRDSLLTLYQAGAEGASYEDGIELVIRGILQSPGFLYLTEIGDGTAADDVVTLTSHELASELSYTLTGGPPDNALLEAASAGTLATPEGREAEVRRLFATDAGRTRAIQVIREWLGIDRIYSTAKDTNIYGGFAGVRDAMGQETADFVREVLDTTPGTVADFLGADWTVVDQSLASVYGVSGSGRVDTPNRIGLLNQGAFLSVYGHAHETAPVLRGVAVLRRIACFDIELPTTLNVQIVPPVPDPLKTTRERFEVHALDPDCAQCHRNIDPLGFSFEAFDSMGVKRIEEKPPGATDPIKIDSAVEVAFGMDFDGPYADSNELATALSQSATARDCFARQIFRSAAAEGQNSDPYETSFHELWEELPVDQQGALLDVLVAYARSSLFDLRGAP